MTVWQSPPPQPPAWPQPAINPYGQANPYAAISLPSITPAPAPALPRTSSPFAWVVIVAGVCAIGCSLLPFYTITSTVTYESQHYSQSFTGNAWYGIFGWLAVVFVAGGAIAAIWHLAASKSRLAAADLAVILAALGLATAIIARIVYPSIENANLVTGRPWFSLQKLYGTGYWLSLVCAIIAVGAAAATLVDARHRAKTTTPAPTLPIPPWTPPQYQPPAQYQPTPQYQPAPQYQPPPQYQPAPPYPVSY